MGLFDDGFDDESSSLALWFDADFEAPAGPTTPIDPATLALTGWWPASYSGAPWSDTVSAGTSGARDLETTTLDPDVGTAVNGYTPAAFTPGNFDSLTTNLSSNTAFIGASGTIFVLFYANSAPAPSGSDYGDGTFLSDLTNAETTFGFTTSGICAAIYDGAYNRVDVACSTGAWHLAQFRWNGTTLEARVDNGTWSSVACGSYTPVTPSAFRVGVTYLSGYYDGSILEILTADFAFSNLEADGVGAFLQEKYALTLGWTVPGVGASTLALGGVRGFGRLGRNILAGLNALALRGATADARPGRASLIGANTLVVSGAPADARLGRATVTTLATVVLSGAASDGRSGRVVVAPGTASLALSGASADGRLGAPAVTTLTSLALAGLSADARASSGMLSGLYTVVLSGLSADARASRGGLSTAYTITLRGVRAQAKASAGTIVPGSVTLAVAGVRTGAKASAGTIASFATLAPSGVPVDARVGRATATAANALALMGVRGRSAPGSVITVPGSVAVSLRGIASDARLGALVLATGGGAPSALALAGIRSDALAGLLTVTTAATIAPKGVYIDARVGRAQTNGLYMVALRGVRARVSTGRASVTTVATMGLTGIAADSRVGSSSLATFYTCSLSGIASEGHLGPVRLAAVWALSLAGVRADAQPGAATLAPGPVTAALVGVRSDGRSGSVALALTFDIAIALVGVRAPSVLGWLRAYIEAGADVTITHHPFACIRVSSAPLVDLSASLSPLTTFRTAHAPLTVISVVDAPLTRIRSMSTASIYDVGDVAVFTFELNVAGVLTDPSAFSVEVKPPTGVAVTYVYGAGAEITKTSTGIYKASIPCSEAGMWSVFAVGTGAAAGAEPAYFNVRARPS